MKSTPIFLAFLALNVLPGVASPLKAQTGHLVIGIEAVCTNYMSPYDDLEYLLEDLNSRFNARGVYFVPSSSNVPKHYSLKILYKKNVPGTYQSFQAGYKTQAHIRVEPELPRPPGNYALQETTPEERLQSASVRSPGTTLIPYSEPLLNRPGGNLPLPVAVTSVNSDPEITTTMGNTYTHLHFRLYDAGGEKLIWSQRKKTSKVEDIYSAVVYGLAVQISNL